MQGLMQGYRQRFSARLIQIQPTSSSSILYGPVLCATALGIDTDPELCIHMDCQSAPAATSVCIRMRSFAKIHDFKYIVKLIVIVGDSTRCVVCACMLHSCMHGYDHNVACCGAGQTQCRWPRMESVSHRASVLMWFDFFGIDHTDMHN